MIISKTPLRVSFAGGGTDIADYYRTGYGAVVSSAIRKYVYVTVNKRFDDDIPSRGTGLGSSSAIAVGLLNALYAFKGCRASPKKLAEEACEVTGVKDPDRVVKMNPDYMRPADFTNLRGDATNAKHVLGWTPKVRFKELARIMVEADLKLAAEEFRQRKK